MSFDIIITKKLLDTKWDDFVRATEGGHYAQTSLWAQVQAVRGWDVLRMTILENNTVIAGAQILIKQIPLVGSLGYLYNGPVIREYKKDFITYIVDEIQRLRKREKILLLGWRPPDGGEDFEPLLQGLGYKESDLLYEPSNTICIDLTQDFDSILADMSNTKRNAIRRIERGNGIKVRTGKKEDLSIFYHLHVLSSQRNGFIPYPEIFYQKLWEVFEPRGHLKLLVVEYEGEPITADLMILFKDCVIAYKHGWSGTHKKLFPNEAVYWEAIKWAKANGYRYFDFMGLDDAAAKVIAENQAITDEVKRTYNLFKMEYGGKLYFFPKVYDDLHNHLLLSVGYNMMTFVKRNLELIMKKFR